MMTIAHNEPEETQIVERMEMRPSVHGETFRGLKKRKPDLTLEMSLQNSVRKWTFTRLTFRRQTFGRKTFSRQTFCGKTTICGPSMTTRAKIPPLPKLSPNWAQSTNGPQCDQITLSYYSTIIRQGEQKWSGHSGPIHTHYNQPVKHTKQDNEYFRNERDMLEKHVTVVLNIIPPCYMIIIIILPWLS